MAYATVADIEARTIRDLSEAEVGVCAAMLDDAAVLIDTVAPNATAENKKVVSCRMVCRALGDNDSASVPVGASSGSMSGLGYSQSWSIGNGGGAGELYLSKIERQMLGLGNSIGSYSPTQELVRGIEA